MVKEQVEACRKETVCERESGACFITTACYGSCLDFSPQLHAIIGGALSEVAEI